MAAANWKSILQTILEGAPNGLHVDEISNKIFDGHLVPDMEWEEIKQKANNVLLAESKKKTPAFVRVKGKKKGSFKKGYYKLAPLPKKPKNARALQGLKAPEDISTTYTGTAGEYLVMSELLFQGYNVNKMTVDEGVDIVASKGSKFYFIQVKTAYLTEKLTAAFTIQKDRFELYREESNMRYVFCIRYKSCLADEQIECKYFSFTNEQIAEHIHNGHIMQGQNISVKIRFDENFNPVLYNDSKEWGIGYNMDKIVF